MGHFCPFTPLKSQKIKIEKLEKTPWDIILYKCTKSQDNMLYCSWDMAWDRCNLYFSFSFYSPAPQQPKKPKFLKNKKKPGDIIILHMCTKNYDHMMYGSWDMEWNRQNFLSFGSFLILLSHYQPGKSKFLKYEKNYWRCYHFTRVYQKLWSYDVQFVGYDVWHIDGQIDRQTDGQTDRQSEKVTYRVQY